MLEVRVSSVVVAAMVVSFATTASAGDPELDLRGAFRMGVGWSGPFKSSAVMGGFHDQVRFKSLLPWLGLELATGLTFVSIPPAPGSARDASERGYSSFDFGFGLSFRSEKGGPLAVMTGTVGMLFDSPAEVVHVIGFGMAITTDVYPLYLGFNEALRCEKGAAYTYIGSSLFFWTSLRDDVFGDANAPSWAAGFGLDIARSMMLPPLGLVLHDACSKPKARDVYVE